MAAELHSTADASDRRIKGIFGSKMAFLMSRAIRNFKFDHAIASMIVHFHTPLFTKAYKDRDTLFNNKTWDSKNWMALIYC